MSNQQTTPIVKPIPERASTPEDDGTSLERCTQFVQRTTGRPSCAAKGGASMSPCRVVPSAAMEKVSQVYVNIYHLGELAKGPQSVGVVGGSILHDGDPEHFWHPNKGTKGDRLPRWANEAYRAGTLVQLCHPNLIRAAEAFRARRTKDHRTAD